MTERNNKHKYKSLFKNKFKKDYRDFVNNTYKYKNNKKSNKQGNIKENKISDSFDKNKLIIKSTKKVIKDKKEQNLNISDKKNIKENKEKNYVIKKETNKNKSYKLKNRDLLKINQSFKSNSKYKKDSYIEESTDNQKNSKNDINSDKKKGNILDNKKKMNISDISKTNSKDEETTNENKKKINPKKMSLLIDHIKKILEKEKKKEKINLNNLRQAELKRSYQLFKEQIDKIEKEKKPKIKRLFTELFDSNKKNSLSKRKIVHLLAKDPNKYIDNNAKNKDTIKDDEEEENIKNIKSEKNKLLIEEMNLINEIKFYISTMDDPEKQKKFENLLKQIESLKKLNDKDYIKQIKESFGNFKIEIEDIFRAKEIEDRINGFVTNLDKEVNKVEIKRSFYENLLNIVDHKFKSISSNINIENNL
jgi:hypothetical protein